MSLTQDIKDYGLDIGYSKVGITHADGFPHYAEELKSRYDSYVWYIESPRRPLVGAVPRNIMPSAKSVVSVAYDYSKESFPEKLVGKIGRIYQGRCYNAPEHRINGARFRLMQDFLAKNGCELGQGVVLPERLTAANAGITTYGKNNFAFTKETGSFILLSCFVVDKELDYDEPTMEIPCPDKCTLCIDACPTGALSELKLDVRRCIAFNSFWAQDEAPGDVTSYIPPDIREKMGSWIYGCDICQEVCPRNQKRLKAKLSQNEFLTELAEDFEIPKLLNMTDGFYTRAVYPLMYNYITDKKYFRRNAAIALGNTGDSRYIPDLARAMEDPEEMVRGCSAWALGKIGGDSARRILEKSLARETSESVVTEIRAGLEASSAS
jgi:epoxyqueuosine reductase